LYNVEKVQNSRVPRRRLTRQHKIMFRSKAKRAAWGRKTLWNYFTTRYRGKIALWWWDSFASSNHFILIIARHKNVLKVAGSGSSEQ